MNKKGANPKKSPHQHPPGESTTDDIIVLLTDVVVNGPFLIVGEYAHRVMGLLEAGKRLGLAVDSADGLEHFFAEQQEERFHSHFQLIVLLPDFLESIEEVTQRAEFLLRLSETLGPDGRILVFLSDPGNLGPRVRRFREYDGPVNGKVSHSTNIDWIRGTKMTFCGEKAANPERKSIVTLNEILIVFNHIGLEISVDFSTTYWSASKSLAVTRLEGRWSLFSQYGNGHIYDVLNPLPEDYRNFVLSYISEGMQVLEPGCGTGRLGILVAQKGARLTGIDIDSNKLELAQRKITSVNLSELMELRHGDIRAFDLDKRFDFVFLSSETLSLLPDVRDRQRAMSCIARHLEPGARLLIILENPACYLVPGFRHSRIRRVHLNEDEDDNILIMSEDRTFDPINLHQKGMNRYWVESDTHPFRLEHVVCHGIVLRDEILLYAWFYGLELVEEFGSYNKEPLTASSPKAIYVLKKLP